MITKSKYRPSYLHECAIVANCRAAISSTQEFVEAHLRRFSDRETSENFILRKQITPNPPELRVAFNKLCDSIRARMGIVLRESNLVEYVDATRGKGKGIDGKGNSLTSLISTEVLKELLVAKKVGLFVSREKVPETLDIVPALPIVNVVQFERIINYTYDFNNDLVKLLLRSSKQEYEDGYYVRDIDIFQEYEIVDGFLQYTEYNNSFLIIDQQTYNLDLIPFVLIEIDESPVELALPTHDALLQITSSDFLFLNKTNYPIYLEPFDPSFELQKLAMQRQETPEKVGGSNASEKRGNDADVGTSTGRRYPKGSEPPSFLAPPIQHLEASEKKQEKLKNQIEEILSIDTLRINYKQASAETKREDKETLIGSIQRLFDLLESAELRLALIWHRYYNYIGSNFKIEYPKNFDLRSEASRISTCESKLKLRDDVSSKEFKYQITLEVVRDLLPGANITTLEKISAELLQSGIYISAAKIVDLKQSHALDLGSICKGMGLSEDCVKLIEKERETELTLTQMRQNPQGRPPVIKGEEQ